jgi:F-type H+-transporting ATPase subunit delta
MLSTIIAQRYAKSLLESAVHEGLEDRIAGEASALAEALGDDRDVKRFLTEPLSSPDDKLGVLLGAFPEPPHALTKSFLRTVMENRRERFLPLMLKEFLRLIRESKGELSAKMSTAYQLDARQKALIERELSRQLKRKVDLIPVVDRSILGGAVLQVGDTVYDGSLKHALARLEESLKQEPLRRTPKAPAKVKKPKAKKAKPKARVAKRPAKAGKKKRV